jgi:hypothetical protein
MWSMVVFILHMRFATLYLSVGDLILSSLSFGRARAGSPEGGGCLYEDGEALRGFCSSISRIWNHK